MFLYLLLSSVAVLTLEVNKADFYDLKCEWQVSRPQQQVSKGEILKKNTSACDCSQAPIPKDDGNQNDLRNLGSSKYRFKYCCWTSRIHVSQGMKSSRKLRRTSNANNEC